LYYLTSTRGQYELNSRASGSTVQGTKRSEFNYVNIVLPSTYEEQKEIANIISSFDKKMKLLQEQNKTLEIMAKTIFKEWFIDFNYPNSTDEMIDSELGKIPKGWRVGRLEEFIEFINGYAFKSKELLTESTENTYKVFKMGDIKKGGGLHNNKTKSYFKKENVLKTSKHILKDGDLLMSMTDMKDAISLLGHTALMIYNNEYIVNQRVGLIRANNNINIDYPFLYLLTNNKEFISNLRGRANSGVQVNLSTQSINESKFIVSDKKINQEFNDIVKPIFHKIKNNTFQIKTLIDTKDKILPNLMSGKVRIKDFVNV